VSRKHVFCIAVRKFDPFESAIRKTEESVAILRRVADLRPDSSEAHLNLGIALADNYRSNSALEEFTKAVKLAPQSAAPHYNLGRAYYDLRRYDDAVAELKIACQLAPPFPMSLYFLALAQTKLTHYEEASVALRQMLALQPRNADALFLLGQSYQKLNQTQDAITAWQKAVEIDPAASEALYTLSRALLKTDPVQAKVYRDRFVALQQQKQLLSQAAMLGNFALASANRGDYAQAISQFHDALKECGDCESKADLHKDLGLTECKSGDIDAGEKDLSIAKSLKPLDADIQKALNIIAYTRAQHQAK
jgi:protein O-GlcNAc transferase